MQTTSAARPDAISARSAPPKVLISILNWNGARKTVKCLQSMENELDFGAAVTVIVIDNGSREDDVALLAEQMPSTAVLKRLPVNLGFTGGHNVAIDIALKEGYDFIWLLNNDAVVAPGCLRELVKSMLQDQACGAVSPVLRDLDDGHIVRCVNTHDWNARQSRRIDSIEEAQRLQSVEPASVWVDGTAVLFRVAALAQVGPLDDRLFAYFDDNDIGTRLSNRGWYSRCAFDASVFHENRKHFRDFPLYLIYLYQRNEMLFWYKNTPVLSRPLLWLKLIDEALFYANRLERNGYPAQGRAILLAMQDFVLHKFGPPAHERKVPLITRLVNKLAGNLYAKKLAAMPPLPPAHG